MNTNVDGEYSLIGALFLDYRNKPDFSDFNSIIYGHHMRKIKCSVISLISQTGISLDSHRYGSLFYEGKTHGIEFFAFLEVDAYDELYTPAVEGEETGRAIWNRLWNRLFTQEICRWERLTTWFC